VDAIWAFLSDPDNQKTLGWLGGGFVVLAGGIRAAIQHFAKPAASAKPQLSTSVSADRHGVAAGGNVTITNQGLGGWRLLLLVAAFLGAVLLALAFTGTRINVENGVAVGGDVKNSDIKVEGGRAGSNP
jgi:hypothetical protein